MHGKTATEIIQIDESLIVLRHRLAALDHDLRTIAARIGESDPAALLVDESGRAETDRAYD